MTNKEQAIEYWRDRMKYSENIAIDCFTPAPRTLTENQWYALMVTDYGVARRDAASMDSRDYRKFWDRERGRLGLEQTSGGQVYISKDFTLRDTIERGETCVVTVTNPALCCVLGGVR